jgi:hypothetical protein
MNQLGFYDINGKTQFHQPYTKPYSRFQDLKAKTAKKYFRNVDIIANI